MSSMPDDEHIYDNNFFWSFYELNNGEIIDLNFTENLENDKVWSNDFHFGYTKHELKSGEIIEYEFGNASPEDGKEMSREFFDWFDSNPPVKDLKNFCSPTENEEKCVKEFFIKNILKTKEVATDVINT